MQKFERSTALLGTAAMQRLAEAKVIVFGVGGVGSWCAECLVRTGLVHLTIVDNDVVAPSNINRQLMATSKTVGLPKVEVMKQRLEEINPDAQITAIQEFYSAETSDSFLLGEYDYVIDAIDSVESKAHLILSASEKFRVQSSEFRVQKPVLFSSMGAALRLDPFMIREAEFWNVKGDGLARALRNRFKKNKTFPACKFRCVYSDEPPISHSPLPAPQPKASIASVTAVFGLVLASMVIKDINSKIPKS